MEAMTCWKAGGGADHLVGRLGEPDTASYAHSPGGVTVDLTLTGPQATENNHDAAGDTLIRIENLEGSNYGDTLTGDEQDNYFWGKGGADVVDGGGGIDTANFHYLRSNQGVTVDLGVTDAEGWTTVTGGDGSGDKLKNIENLDGGHGDDTLRGDENANNFWGGGGNDVLEGRGGADILDGGLNARTYQGANGDTASYAHSPGGVTVDLTLTGPQATENNYDAAGDTLIGIEHLEGSNHGDRLTGDGWDNWLVGGAGNDVLQGGAGPDVLEGGTGNDVLEGGAVWDVLKGGEGIDHLYGGTQADKFVFGRESVVDTGNAEETRTLSDETDTVKDFTQSEGDRLDLRGLKDHSLFTGGTTPGTELSLRETEGAAFTGVKGQVKWWQDGGQTHVQVDLDGIADADGEYDAEFQVTLDGLHDLTGADLILA